MTVSTELDQRFRAAAVAEGLLDVGYDLVDSPLGALFVATTPRGLCRIAYDAEPEQQLDRLARSHGTRVLRAPRALDEVKRELDDYFEGRRQEFELELDLRLVDGFQQTVLRELAGVPYGQVTTYGSLAAKAGRPRAARAVGTIMNRNPVPIVLPCHRVVGANGSLTGYGGGLDRKQALLKLEGATIV
jgi:methylated-DNA-[protein]-cysteine S-methyltransferase